MYIPRLPFAHGWHMPRRAFRRPSLPICALTLELMRFTGVCIGYRLHWLMPNLAPAAAFARSAVRSPTDAVALTSIIGRGPGPHRPMPMHEDGS